MGLFKTMLGIVFVEVALGFPFGVILYRNFMGGIPREIDEAAIIDGCGGFGLFFRIILPLLKPVTATTIITSSVTIFNDFVNPLYFFPGSKNVTVQLTLYNFMSQYTTQYNLLFMNILVITIPLLILFIFFNQKIVSGMTAGSVKG
ncbi:L-arabinose transport system permease protein AraQ [compost metagenome]